VKGKVGGKFYHRQKEKEYVDAPWGNADGVKRAMLPASNLSCRGQY